MNGSKAGGGTGDWALEKVLNFRAKSSEDIGKYSAGSMRGEEAGNRAIGWA